MRLHIVLLQPQIPQNTGNIVRTCAAVNATLHLVHPMGFQWDDKQLKRSGLDYWSALDLHFYDTTEAFFKQHSNATFYYFTTKAKQHYAQVTYPEDVFLIFGREDKGIEESILLQNPNTCVRMPMSTGIRSLNLSNTVAIAAYEVLRQWDFPALESSGTLHEHCWP